jgi:hypothetical protein
MEFHLIPLHSNISREHSGEMYLCSIGDWSRFAVSQRKMMLRKCILILIEKSLIRVFITHDQTSDNRNLRDGISEKISDEMASINSDG